MSTQMTTTTEITPEERALMLGDLSKLSTEQRSSLYSRVCESLGLNPLTQPFAYLTLNNKLVLYAQRNCTDQLRSNKNVSLSIVSREKVGDLYVVTARATLPSGRCDESVGAVTIMNLKGDALANAIMKAETKAKRRVTLSICGLSMMDETEVETVRDAVKVPVDAPVQVTAPAPAMSVGQSISPSTIVYTEPAPPDVVDQDELDLYLGADMSDVAKRIDEYTITFGKYTGRGLRDIGLHEAQRYVDWIRSKAKEDGKEIKGQVLDFVDMVELYAKEYQHDADIEYWKSQKGEAHGADQNTANH